MKNTMDKNSLLAQIETLKKENTDLFQQLSMAREHLELYLNHAPLMACIKDADGRFRYINQTFIDAMGFSEKDWYGKDDYDLWPEDDARKLREHEQRILDTGITETIEDYVEDGEWPGHWVTNKFRFSDKKGNYFIGCVGVDLTPQTKTVNLLKEVINTAAATSTEKSRFLSLVSHELRTPLHSILASVEQWGEVQGEEERKELLSYINFGVARLRSQVDNLVLLAETDDEDLRAGEFEFETRVVLARISAYTEGLIADGVNFHCEVDAAIPELCESDPYLIEHMVRTVLENACRHTEHGRVLLAVKWDAEREYIIFRIEDSGCGMTEKQQKRIYSDVIELTRGLDRETTGIGVGLTICCRLSALLHADLLMESQIGLGTQIELSVPVKPLAKAAMRRTRDQAKGAVLIVEDNPVNAKVLEHMVRKIGFLVDTVVSGDEALRRLTNNVYDLIFMDIQMPVMDGITATRWIRRRGIDTPIVAISANSDVSVRQRCAEHGINDFLVKPARRNDVFRILERQVSLP